MRVVRRIIAATSVGVFVIASITAAYVVPILATEIDPNLGRPQCPGGRDWDQPGSSCHDGLIVDYWLPPVSIKDAKQGIRRGEIVRWQGESRKNKRGR
jgi:hypothetical protein